MKFVWAPVLNARHDIAATRINLTGFVTPEIATQIKGLPLIVRFEKSEEHLISHEVVREVDVGDREQAHDICMYGWQPHLSIPQNARYVLCDFRQHANLAATGKPVRLAMHLANFAEFTHSLHQGYQGGSGWFFLKDIQAAEFAALGPAGRPRLLHLMRMVNQGADWSQLDAALRQDEALVRRFLHHVKRRGLVQFMDPQAFSSTLMQWGREEFYRWLVQELLATSPVAPAAVKYMGMVRGAAMESLGVPYLGEENAEGLFATGLLSTLKYFVNVQPLLKSLHLPASVMAALNDEPAGIYQPYLLHVLATEGCDEAAQTADQAKEDFDALKVVRAVLKGMRFANETWQ